MGDNNNPDFKNITRDIKNVGNVDIGDKTYNTIYQEKPIPKALTTNIPLLSKDKIIGRDTYLDKLHQILFDKKDAILVNGFGGVGKTTIAQVYAHTFWDEYAHVAWITLISDDFVFELVNAPGLKESLNISADGVDIQQLFSRLMVEINRIGDKPNLLILDNAVEKLSQFKSYLPSSHEWHILVTAREDINGFTSHYLDFLDEADAIALFKHHYTLKIITDDQINQLVRKADYHTLTIEILAKTAQLQRLSFDTLKEALQQDIKSGVKTARSGEEKIENITGYLSSIFNLIALDENEIWVLKNLIFLPSDYHSFEILNTITDPASSSKQVIFAETLTSLVQKSWIIYNDETDSYRMHVVVSEVIKKKERISFKDISSLVKNMSSLVRIDQNVDNPTEKFKWVPFGLNLAENLGFIQDISVDEENQISGFYSNLGVVLKDLGDYEGAKILMTKSILSSENNFGVDHPSTAIRYSNLGVVLKHLGDYEGAKGLLIKAITSDERNFGVDHPTTAISYSNLATVLKDLGDYEGAKILFTKAMVSTEKNYGVNHPTTAISYSNLATVLQDLGDYEGAKNLLTKALYSTEKNFGIEHPYTARSYSNLAMVLKDLGNYEGAKSLLTKAMVSTEKNFGFDHPSTAIRYSNLATVFQALGDYEGAKSLLTKAMISNEKNFGFDHPSIAISYSNLATVLQDLNEIPEAIVLLKKALEIFKKTLPENHPNIKTVEQIYNHFISLS